MEETSTKIRQLVAQLSEMEPPSKTVQASPLMRAVIARINALAASSPLRLQNFAGIWRKGPSVGERWGAWSLNPAVMEGTDPKLCLKDGSECLVEFLPQIAGKVPTIRLGTGGWAVFSCKQRDMDIHRQLWQDYWNCLLPSWVHIHHTGGCEADEIPKELDNRLRFLEIRDQKQHGKEHGQEGGTKSRRGPARLPASASASLEASSPAPKRQRTN